MPIDISQSPVFITPWTLFLIALILVVGAIIILTIIERKLNKKISLKKIDEENIFTTKVNLLRENKSKPELMLKSIDSLARDFFEKKYKVNKNLKYSSLSEYFKKNNDASAIRFCEKMQEALYAGEELDSNFVNNLLNNLDFLINSENRDKFSGYSNKESNKNQKKLFSVFNKETDIEIPSNLVTLQSGISNRHSRTNGDTINGNVYNMIQEKESIKNTTPEIKIIKTEDLTVLTPEEERNVFRIKNYLKEGLDREFSINLLRQRLMESKFNDKEINEAIKRVKIEFANQKGIGQNEAPTRVKPKIIPYVKEQINTKRVYINQKINAPPRLKSSGLFGVRFLNARESPRSKERGFQDSRHNQDAYNNINGLDNYNRIKEKINQKRIIASDQDSLV